MAETKEQKIIHTWWMRAILAVLMLGIAYGFASLAIDSGSLFHYALAIFFIGWALFQVKRSIHYLRAH